MLLYSIEIAQEVCQSFTSYRRLIPNVTIRFNKSRRTVQNSEIDKLHFCVKIGFDRRVIIGNYDGDFFSVVYCKIYTFARYVG